jgi:transposase
MSETSGERDDTDWRERARELSEHGGIPERRAQAVALREQGLSYQAIADRLGLSDRSSIRKQVETYRETRADSEWLVEHGPQL